MKAVRAGSLPVELLLADRLCLHLGHNDYVTVCAPIAGRSEQVEVATDGESRCVWFHGESSMLIGSGTAGSHSGKASREWLHVRVPVATAADQLQTEAAALRDMLRPLWNRPVQCHDLYRQVWALWKRVSGSGRLGEDPSGRAVAEMSVDLGMLTLITTLILQTRTSIRDAPVGRSRSLSEPTLKSVVDFIERRLSVPIGLTDLSRLTGMSTSRFSRGFRVAMGRSPYQYILARRVARAETLLKQSSLALVDIADECGFASQSHMTDVMRARVGLTPGQVRRQAKNLEPLVTADLAPGRQAAAAAVGLRPQQTAACY